GELAVSADPGRHVPAEESSDRLAATRERDVVHAPCIDPCRLSDQSGEDVIGAARGATAPGERLGPPAEHLEELMQVADRRCGGDSDDLVLTGESGDWRRLRGGDGGIVAERGGQEDGG